MDYSKLSFNELVELAKKSELKTDDKKYVLVRCYAAGVFAGYIESENDLPVGKEVVLLKARRIWAWYGAASLSQLAQSGPSKPNECKFPEEVNRIRVQRVEEILEISPEAEKIIKAVQIWKN